MLKSFDNKLIYKSGNETLEIIPWGENSFRVLASKYPKFNERKNALTEEIPETDVKIELLNEYEGKITNGKISANINSQGKLCFYNKKGEIILEEYLRSRSDNMAEGVSDITVEIFNSALNIKARQYKSHVGGDYELKVKFEADNNEKIFGMGQYQQEFLDLKNSKLELAHRNSQASVPFYISNKGYGFLWNNPAIGEVTFGKNLTEWVANSTKQMDYWVTCGDTPAEIEEAYAKATGTVPMIPEYGLGFWQCKLRYQTQEELLEAAREYKRRNLPIDLIVVDFYHWPIAGDFKFDKEYWPDPKAMIAELNELGIELMVSVWPTIDEKSENFALMKELGLLVQTERGISTTMDFLGNNIFYDTTNPEARAFVWEKCKQNYYDLGIKTFWLDEAEPEYTVYDFDNYRYYEGTNLEIGNKYPAMYSRGFYEGLKAEGNENIINLVRCAWAGSQKYGALVWSGDIDSSFESLRNQLSIGLNMGIAGIPWWTTDIGGFHGGVNDDELFRELVIRWFQFGAFSPVFRMHGDREPHSRPLGNSGGGRMPTGAGTEVWQYGQQALEIMTKFLLLREALRDYIRTSMRLAHEKGSPIIRPLFYDYPNDKKSWDIETQYMFGNKILVAPVLYERKKTLDVYFPCGDSWVDLYSGEKFEGGETYCINLKIEEIPVFTQEQNYEEFREVFKDIFR